MKNILKKLFKSKDKTTPIKIRLKEPTQENVEAGDILLSVGNLNKIYKGPKLVISPLQELDDSDITQKEYLINLPLDNKKIKENMHVVGENTVINPLNFILNEFESDNFTKTILDYCIKILVLCIVHEVKSHNDFTINGIKRLDLKFPTGHMHFNDSVNLYHRLIAVINWIYEENTQTRLKLIANRLSLDIDKEESLYCELNKYLPGALQESKEKYGYIINERSDEYNKQLRDLQTKSQKQIDNYSDKIKSLINGLFRDVLAGIFLVAFGLFSKISPEGIHALFDNKTILLLFKGLAIYFLASIILQTAVNFTDLILSRINLIQYANTTRNFFRIDQIKKYIKNFLLKREISFIIFYFLIIIIYSFIICFCWNIHMLSSLFKLEEITILFES